MYDQRQEPNEFVADNVKDATGQAAEFFGVDAGELKITIAPDGEIFGTGGRTVIVAMPKEIAARGPRPDSGGGGGERDRGDRGGRGRGDDRPRGRERNDRGEGRGRGRGREGGRERGGRSDKREERSAPRERVEKEVQEAIVDSKGTPKGDIGEIGKFLLGAVERHEARKLRYR